MKKLIVFIWLLCACACFAQISTPNLGLSTPPHGSANWDGPLNSNFSLLDSYLSGGRQLPAGFWQNASLPYSRLTGVPTSFPADWNFLQNRPALFPPILATSTTPGGVFMPVDCPNGQHVVGINFVNGQLKCSPDVNSSFALEVNGIVIAQGITAINFVGSAGMNISASVNSSTGIVTYTVTGSTATQALVPTASPLPGQYSGAQNVTLSCGSPSPTIYYTTNGTTPTHGSSVYSTPIAVTNGTINAICASSGLADSNVQSFTYSVTAPAVALNPTALIFSAQAVGFQSSFQAVTLTNSGNANLTISSITISGDYSQNNNCPSNLTPGAICTINVAFTPTVTGTRSGTLTITDNASGSPHTVSMTGTGALPTASLSSSSLSFTSQLVGTSSPTQTVTITNSSSVPLTFSSNPLGGTNPGDFSQTNNCSTVAAGGGTCQFVVTFTPAASGARSATLTLFDNAATSPQTITLTGTGTVPSNPVASITSSLNFSAQKVGTTSAAQTVTLSNTGNATLLVSNVAITGTNAADYAQSNNCTSIAAGSSCQIPVTFKPTATGTRTASVSVTDNATGSPHVTALAGTGVVPTATVSPTSINFGTQQVGISSGIQSVTLTNTSGVGMSLVSIGVSGDYAQTNNCTPTISAGASCTINVSFTPTQTGTRAGTLTISDDASNNPQIVSLTGAGGQPGISISLQNFGNFGVVPLGSYSLSGSITNTGNINLVISNMTQTINTNGAFGSSIFSCVGTITPGNSCSFSVGFSPTSPETAYSYGVSITDNASGSPHSIGASGATQ